MTNKKSYSYAPNPFKIMPIGIRKLSVANAIYILLIEILMGRR